MDAFYTVLGLFIMYSFVHTAFIVVRLAKNKVSTYETILFVLTAIFYLLLIFGSSN